MTPAMWPPLMTAVGRTDAARSAAVSLPDPMGCQATTGSGSWAPDWANWLSGRGMP
jgi:hypothetical protein